ncbi:MAG: AAA family ATPase, partial [Methylocystis sp.]
MDRIRELLNNYLIGSDELIEKLLICLLADGHILIEGAPGLGKTRSA